MAPASSVGAVIALLSYRSPIPPQDEVGRSAGVAAFARVQISEGGSVLRLGHPRHLSLGVRMAFVVSSIYATDI